MSAARLLPAFRHLGFGRWNQLRGLRPVVARENVPGFLKRLADRSSQAGQVLLAGRRNMPGKTASSGKTSLARRTQPSPCQTRFGDSPKNRVAGANRVVGPMLGIGNPVVGFLLGRTTGHVVGEMRNSIGNWVSLKSRFSFFADRRLWFGGMMRSLLLKQVLRHRAMRTFERRTALIKVFPAGRLHDCRSGSRAKLGLVVRIAVPLVDLL